MTNRIDLTKWPLLLVDGQSVTPEQADEILIRTCVPEYLDGNDTAWAATVYEILRWPRDNWHARPELRGQESTRLAWLRAQWDAQNARREELGIVGLEYLYTSRIASSWFGGPHGWCDWNGRIFSNNYNIGKWPSSGEITDEWTEIAQMFPFLDLTSQLITDEGAGELAGEWRVKDGEVTYNADPTERLSMRTDAEAQGEMEKAARDLAMWVSTRERGVSEDRLRQAVARVEAARTK
jgi:hypothetical protein